MTDLTPNPIATTPLTTLADRALRHALEVLAPRAAAAAPAEEYFPVTTEGGRTRALSGPDLDAWIGRAEGEAALRLVGRGVAYLLKQQELPSNAFAGWMVDQGLVKPRVYEAIRVAKMFGRLRPELLGLPLAGANNPVEGEVVRHAVLPTETLGDSPEGAERPSLLPTDYQSLVDLAALPVETVEALIEHGEMAELCEQPRAAFKKSIQAIKRLEGRLERTAEAAERAQAEARSLKVEPPNPNHNARVTEARTQGTARALLALDAVDRIEALAAGITDIGQIHSAHALQLVEIKAGLGPLWIALKGVHARVAAAMAQMQEEFGAYLPQELPEFDFHAEAEAWDEFRLLLTMHGGQIDAEKVYEKQQEALPKRERKQLVKTLKTPKKLV